jgi:hypothetical protein
MNHWNTSGGVPPHELRLAKVIYLYWRDRRVERKGHKVIPHLNVSIKFNSVNRSWGSTPCQFDESDVPNESYVCFCTSAYLDRITSGAYKCNNSLTGSAPVPSSHGLMVMVDIIILGVTDMASYVLSTTKLANNLLKAILELCPINLKVTY